MFPPTYHLRRVNPKPNVPEELILLGEVTKFGRNADNVDVVLTSAVYSNMISRDHAIISGEVEPHTRRIIRYKIRDNSLNGTYIDDKRVKDEMFLHDGTVIKFGHMNGAAIKPGFSAPQANAEFSFVFEKCTPNRKYCGWEGYDRRRTVVCVGDGKPMAETGEDYRTKRKPLPKSADQVTSTTAPTSSPFPMHSQPIHPPAPAPLFHPIVPPETNIRPQLMNSWTNNPSPFAPTALNPMRQQPMLGMRVNGQYQSVPQRVGSTSYSHSQPVHCPPSNPSMERKDNSSIVPIRSPPVECDSSVPSPPKNGDTRTGQADSSQQSPRRAKDDDEDTFSVPDSPPRAPRPHDIPGRSVTNSPAPPSPRPVEKAEIPKVEKSKAVSPKKPVNPGKAPKTGGGGEKRKNNEVSRLLDDLTEGSFMLQQMKKNEGGRGDRRKSSIDGKKSKRPASKNKLHRQLSSASSDEDSDDDEVSGVPIRRTSTSNSRPSMVGKKASSAVGTSKELMKKNGGNGRKDDSDDSDVYEATDDSEGEMKKGKRKMVKNNSIANAKKGKAATKKSEKKVGAKKKKKKGSEDSSDGESEGYVMSDGEKFVDTEDTKCDSNVCQQPTSPKVHWVQCNGCDRWMHSFCQFGVNREYTGTAYYCGCGEAEKKTKKRKKKST